MTKSAIDAWVSATFQVDLEAYPAQPASAISGGSNEAASGASDGLTIPGVPFPIPTPDPRKHSIVNGKLLNKTSKTLRLRAKDTTSGDLTEDPPDEILPKSEDEEFRAESAFPHLFKGAVGSMQYIVDDQDTRWVLTWSIPRVGDNKATGHLTGPNKDKFHSTAHCGAQEEAEFKYILVEKSAGPDTPDAPGAVNANCQITITNNTKLPLSLARQGHERGDFMTSPQTTVAPGASTLFVSVETPHAKEQGCKGFVVWEVGSPSVAIWRVEWDNPEQAKNTALATIDPQAAGFMSLEQIGQGDENVPVAFTLAGGAAGPGPGPGPGPEVDPPFEPPAKPGQPTLRKGDKSPDGWVEYAQQTLNFQLKTNLTVDGDFGNGTLAAVHKFQQAKGLLDDGVIGNQTWAALR